MGSLIYIIQMTSGSLIFLFSLGMLGFAGYKIVWRNQASSLRTIGTAVISFFTTISILWTNFSLTVTLISVATYLVWDKLVTSKLMQSWKRQFDQLD